MSARHDHLEEQDTELLLVMLESTLHGLDLPQDELLEALLLAGGDVELASRNLRGEGSSKSLSAGVQKKKSKRKRGLTGLDEWLAPSKPTTSQKKPRSSATSRLHKDREEARVSDYEGIAEVTSLPSTSKGALEGSPQKPKISLLDVLKPPPPTLSTAPKLAPMLLGTPELVAKHTPTTMHPSILPPELACRLFFRLLDEANASWRRSEWYIGA